MEYIVFDLEWNQCPDGKEQEAAGLPFEVIEIGAVRLNAGREETGSFHRLIRPAVYPRLHHRTREIVRMTEEELAAGQPFKEAAREFLDWAGPRAMFCTWGPGDLTELQRNLNYYGMLKLLRGPLHFYDVQKLFAVNFENMKARRSLEYGIDYLGLDRNGEFHQAMADARYTAEIFRRIDPDVVWAYDSIDVYQPPASKEEEIFAVYNGYTKYISRTFAAKEELLQDREVLSTQCCRCEKNGQEKNPLACNQREGLLLRGRLPGARICQGKNTDQKDRRGTFFCGQDHQGQRGAGAGGPLPEAGGTGAKAPHKKEGKEKRTKNRENSSAAC